ncbi:uncharacterized protein ASPGLDRAFT_36204 [Aspergillus glaucus CBS 516.65]|uniref:Uncharacterized protein n=1 Tax=Aspergillus glaucus CBS 516.65 TaxID=1160497 RepID=A0A1L9VHN5_ASPGL|nr:hypothetical protein ASPGLDRAFT_36204 [Aspergillus glaucus CBS 516.65]OJJ83447.1 hypothetical protein ASPGLDRAFT_36204 [Aspergillus glaucus CBS 516.65]
MVHLLIPDIKAYPGNRKVEWLNKLVGKKIGETTDATKFAGKDLQNLIGSSALAIGMADALQTG